MKNTLCSYLAVIQSRLEIGVTSVSTRWKRVPWCTDVCHLTLGTISDSAERIMTTPQTSLDQKFKTQRMNHMVPTTISKSSRNIPTPHNSSQRRRSQMWSVTYGNLVIKPIQDMSRRISEQSISWISYVTPSLPLPEDANVYIPTKSDRPGMQNPQMVQTNEW